MKQLPLVFASPCTALQLRSDFWRHSQPWLQWRQIARARARGLRPADESERQYADAKDLYFCRAGGPRYVLVADFGERQQSLMDCLVCDGAEACR